MKFSVNRILSLAIILTLLGFGITAFIYTARTKQGNAFVNTGHNFSLLNIILSFILIAVSVISIIILLQIKSANKGQQLLEQKFSALLDAAPDATIIVNETGIIQMVNKQTGNLFGYTPDEIIGQPVEILIPAELKNKHHHHRTDFVKAARVRTMGAGMELNAVKKNGTIFPVEISLSPIQTEQGMLVSASVRDISDRKSQEEKLRKSETNFQLLVSSVKDYAIFLLDINGKVASWNAGAEIIKGYKAEEVIGKPIDIFYTAEEIEKGIPQNNLKKARENGHYETEGLRLRKNGSSFYASVVFTSLFDKEGHLYGYAKVTKDITDRIKAEKQLKEFEYFFNNSNDLSCIANTEGYFEIVNPSFTKVLGYSENELSKNPFIDFVHPDDIATTLETYGQLKSGATVIHFINRYRKKDDNYLWLDWNATPNATTGKLYCIARDITERKKAEDALYKLNEELEQRVKERTAEIEKNETRFRALIENNNDIISLMDKSFNVIYRSPSASRITGWSNEELIGINGTNKIHPDDIEIAKATIQELMTNPGKAINTSFRSQHKNGHYLWVEGTVINLLDNEDVKAIVFNFRDVTERIASQAKLAASEMRFRLLIENSADGIDLSDEFSNNIYRSPGAVKITGILPKDNQRSLTHPDDVEIIKNKSEELIKKPGIPIAFQARFRHAQGHYIWMEGTFTNLLQVEGVHAIVTNFRDITQRKELEVLLHNANVLARIGGWEIDMIKGKVYWSDITREIHETEYDYVPDLATGIHFYKEGKGRDLITQKVKEAIELGKPWDVELQIVTAKNNERWIRTIGETEFVNGKCVRIYGSFQDIDQRKTAEEKITETLKEKNIILESIGDAFFAVDKDWTVTYWNRIAEIALGVLKQDIIGKNLWEKFSDSIDTVSYKNYHQAISNNEVVHFEDHYPALNRWYEISAYPSENGLSVYFKDITDRKKAQLEIQKLNEELEQKVISRTEQLRRTNEELEAFSYSVSHDLRAPLRGIIGFTNILDEDYTSKLDDEAKRITGVIKTNTMKMGHLIDDLLAFSRMGRQELLKAPVDTNTMVQEIVNELKATSKNSDLQWVIEPLPVVNADIGTIRQVWINLLSNAIKYSSNTKQPQITIGHYAEEGQQVFFVKDNGVGFNNEYRDKLFRVFQRLHSAEEFEGTGVGLALVGKIIFKHGGKVWAAGEVNKGASFYFSLPVI